MPNPAIPLTPTIGSARECAAAPSSYPGAPEKPAKRALPSQLLSPGEALRLHNKMKLAAAIGKARRKAGRK